LRRTSDTDTEPIPALAIPDIPHQILGVRELIFVVLVLVQHLRGVEVSDVCSLWWGGREAGGVGVGGWTVFFLSWGICGNELDENEAVEKGTYRLGGLGCFGYPVVCISTEKGLAPL
jgi:hypothetical protein